MRPDRPQELGGIWTRHLVTEADAARPERRQHLLEVRELLAREPGERREQLLPLGVLEEEAHRARGRLLLAVGVVEQDLVEVGKGPREPGLVRRRPEAQHGRLLARGRSLP